VDTKKITPHAYALSIQMNANVNKTYFAHVELELYQFNDPKVYFLVTIRTMTTFFSSERGP